MALNDVLITSPNALQNLTTAWQAIELAPASGFIPGKFDISGINMLFDTVAGGAVSVDWYLAEDSGGARPLTTQTNTAFQTGMVAADRQVDRNILRRRHHTITDAKVRKAYLIIKTNAGTADLKASGARCVMVSG